MKKKAALFLALVMTLGLAACGGKTEETQSAAPAETTAISAETEAASEGKTYKYDIPTDGSVLTLKVAHVLADTSPSHQACLYFKEQLEKATDGKVTLDIYPNGTLGNSNEIAESLLEGTIEILAGIPNATVDEVFSVIDTPGLMIDYDTTLATLTDAESPFRAWYFDYCLENGVKPLSMTPTLHRITTSNVELKGIDDLAGLNIRVPVTTLQTTFWSGQGANPTGIDFSEVYIALQNGVCDAQENPVNTISDSKFYEVQKYLVHTNHMMYVDGFEMGKVNWDNTSPELQEILCVCAQEASDYQRELQISMEKEYTDNCIAGGMTEIFWTEEDFAKMYEQCTDVYDYIKTSSSEEGFNLLVETYNDYYAKLHP